jgi:seryl-tRNA synthetase
MIYTILAYEHSCEKLMILVEDLLKSLSNRDSREFSEKELKVAIASHIKMSELYVISSEHEIKKKYADLVLFPRDKKSGLHTLFFELKYIKKSEVPDPSSDKATEIIRKKLVEAVDQLKKYSPTEDSFGKDVAAFAIVFVGDTCVERVNVDMG